MEFAAYYAIHNTQSLLSHERNPR